VPPLIAARDILSNAIMYFCKHRERMRYTTSIANGLPIGSGPVEAAAKNIVQARLKRSGMRWSRDGGQHVLDLRCDLKSNSWQVIWDTLTKASCDARIRTCTLSAYDKLLGGSERSRKDDC